MARSGQVRVSITGDASGLKRSVAESETAIGRLNAAARNARSSLDSAGIAGVALGSAMGTLAANAAPMVIDQFKKAVSGAIDLGEQTSKATVIFREQGRAVVDWSDDLAKSFGVSEVAALKAAGEFGNMLVPMGILPAKAADMSRSMVQLAGDMASFNNASPQETLEALRSGLAGESEPLRRFGVFLSDARIKQEALNLHLSDGHGQLTASQKALATYAVIMKDTTNAQGDFSRTSDSLANRQRALQAQWDNVTAKIGTAMLPVISKLAAGLTNVVNTMEAFHNPEAFQKFQQAQGELGSALSRLLVVAERYPDLKANQGFRDLRVQLEGTENRITVARNRYIQAVQDYNVLARSFPTNLTAMVFGYQPKPNFSVSNEAQISAPPQVDFGKK